MDRIKIRDAIRRALVGHKMPAKNLKILKGKKRGLFKGHCADATAVAYILFGREEGLSAYSDGKGNRGHYWLAKVENGRAVDYCDITEENPKFNYSKGKVSKWIHRYKSPKILKNFKSPKPQRRWQLYLKVLRELGK